MRYEVAAENDQKGLFTGKVLIPLRSITKRKKNEYSPRQIKTPERGEFCPQSKERL